MGRISGEYADFTIITDDNPRYENPKAIREEIEKGIIETSGKYINVEGRAEAIYKAIKMLEENDLLLIAGKGAEKYQEINGKKIKFSDCEEIKKITETR